jgi:hypothetical protein
MDHRCMSNEPALAYVKELGAWIVLNNKSELISWTDEPAEIAWLSTWLLGRRPKTKTKPNVSDPKPKVIKPTLPGISSPRINASPCIVLPMSRP